MIKRVKKFLFLIFMMFLAISTPVKAVTSSIQIGAGTNTKAFVGGVSVHYIGSMDGKYCFYALGEGTVQNVVISPASKPNTDGGVLYILQNGYPYHSITGDKEKDYYITQTALLWYFDMTKGGTRLSSKFKSTGSDTYGLRKTIQELAKKGYEHRNDSILDQEMNFVLGVHENHHLTLKDGYYVSNSIYAAVKENLSTYTVSLKNAPKGTIISYSSGKEEVYSEEFTLNATDSFQIKVPLKSFTNTKESITVHAVGHGASHLVVGEYLSSDSKLPHVVRLMPGNETMVSDTLLDISSSKVTIVKIDSSTKQPLAGAKLVLKDDSGKTISTWTSTVNAHIFRNLENGTYSIEELNAPKGYQKNTDLVKFTIDDKNQDIKICIENEVEKEKSVVTITKIDQATKKPLAGAVLLVKKQNGVEVARFTTTEESHILMDLPNGIYMVEEISAPLGYVKNNEVITFQIDANHMSHQINFVNAKEVSVPDTASFSSIGIFLLGLFFIGLGARFIYQNGKRISFR